MFFEFCVNSNGCGLNQCERHTYMKQWKYVPITPKGPHPILTWQGMHTKEAIASLNHDRISNLVREGIWTPSFIVSFMN